MSLDTTGKKTQLPIVPCNINPLLQKGKLINATGSPHLQLGCVTVTILVVHHRSLGLKYQLCRPMVGCCFTGMLQNMTISAFIGRSSSIVVTLSPLLRQHIIGQPSMGISYSTMHIHWQLLAMQGLQQQQLSTGKQHRVAHHSKAATQHICMRSWTRHGTSLSYKAQHLNAVLNMYSPTLLSERSMQQATLTCMLTYIYARHTHTFHEITSDKMRVDELHKPAFNITVPLIHIKLLP